MTRSELFKSCLSRAMALCAGREYCPADINARLKLWGLNDIECNRITGLLKKDNFINEERFARAFVKDKFNYNKWGRIKIAAHLRSKNIPDDIIAGALLSIDDEVYLNVIRDLLESHSKSVRARNDYELKSKLLRFGLSKGFESSLLYDLLF